MRRRQERAAESVSEASFEDARICPVGAFIPAQEHTRRATTALASTLVTRRHRRSAQAGVHAEACSGEVVDLPVLGNRSGEVVAGDVEGDEREKCVELGGDAAGEIVVREIQDLESVEIPDPRGDRSGEVVLAEIDLLERVPAGDAGGDLAREGVAG